MLNPPGVQTTAAVVAEVPNSAHPDYGRYENPIFAISDCDRKITLYFGGSYDEDDEFKVETLYKAVSEFRKAWRREMRKARKEA